MLCFVPDRSTASWTEGIEGWGWGDRVAKAPRGCHQFTPVPYHRSCGPSPSVTLGVCPSGSVWPPCSLVLLAHPVVVQFSVFPRACSPQRQLPLPFLGSERSWARGKGEVGGDGSEEIEHSVSGLNGHVSRRASGCQMMDGVGTSLHPPEHRALAPLPPTT